MQKRSLIWAVILLLPVAHAGNAEQANELAAAQMNYQNLLKAQANDSASLTNLQARLKSAEKRLENTQLEVNKLRTEFMLREEVQLTYDAKLKDAGLRLNKAWEAVNGVSTPQKTTKSNTKSQIIKDAVKTKTAKTTAEDVKNQTTQAVEPKTEKTTAEDVKNQTTQAVKTQTHSAIK